MTARVLIVDGHKLFAEAIQAILSSRDLDVVGVASNEEDALMSARSLRPDLVLLDVGAPATGGVSTGAKILKDVAGAKLVAVTGTKETHVVRASVAAGFHGYLTKDLPMSEFVGAIQTVLSGQAVLPHPLAMAMGSLEVDVSDGPLLAQLTVREREILSLLAEGLTGPAMARRLSISPHTVRTHVQNLLGKLQVHTRLEAAAFAVRHGITAPEAEARLA